MLHFSGRVKVKTIQPFSVSRCAPNTKDDTTKEHHFHAPNELRLLSPVRSLPVSQTCLLYLSDNLNYIHFTPGFFFLEWSTSCQLNFSSLRRDVSGWKELAKTVSVYWKRESFTLLAQYDEFEDSFKSTQVP